MAGVTPRVSFPSEGSRTEAVWGFTPNQGRHWGQLHAQQKEQGEMPRKIPTPLKRRGVYVLTLLFLLGRGDINSMNRPYSR